MLKIKPETLVDIGDMPNDSSAEIFNLISRYMMAAVTNLHLRQRLAEACSDIQKATMAVERGELVYKIDPDGDVKHEDEMQDQWAEWADKKHKAASRVLSLIHVGRL